MQIRGPTVFKGYLKPGEGKVQPDPEHFLPEGWFRTGDLATMSSLGFLQVIDRLKEGRFLVGAKGGGAGFLFFLVLVERRRQGKALKSTKGTQNPWRT